MIPAMPHMTLTLALGRNAFAFSLVFFHVLVGADRLTRQAIFQRIIVAIMTRETHRERAAKDMFYCSVKVT
jgi:F0F1-type ATP synthase alpha subunit